MKRYIKRTLLLTLLPALVLAIALLTLDFGFLRGPIERNVSHALGRDLTINGELSIRLGKSLVIDARDLRLDSPPWLEGEDFLRVQHLLLELDMASLWQDGPPLVRHLAATGVALKLVEDEEGRQSWRFASGKPDIEAPPRTGLPLMLEEVRLEQVAVELRSGRLEEPLHLQIDYLNQQLSPEGMAEAELSGRIAAEPLTFDGVIGPWANLYDGRDIQIAGSGTLGAGRFTLDAQFDHLLEPRRPELTLTIQSPSLADLAETLKLGDWADGEVDLELGTRVEDRQLLAVVDAAIGPLTARLEARADSLQETKQLSLRGTAAGQNFGNIARLAGYPGWPQQPFNLAVSAHRDGSELNIERLDFSLAENVVTLAGGVPKLPSLMGAELDLDVAGPQLAEFSEIVGAGPLPDGPFRITGTVMATANGPTAIDLLVETTPIAGWVRGQLNGDRLFHLDLQLNGPELASLRRLQGLAGLPAGPFSISGSITGDLAGSHADLAFSAPPGEGHFTASLLRYNHLQLDLEMAGALASRFGPIFGISGLPDAPWRLRLGLDRPESPAYDLRVLDFQTDGTRIELSGKVGAASIRQGTDLRLRFSGDSMARFQSRAPAGITLLAEPFDLRGRISGDGNTWLLDGVRAQLGPTRIEADGQIGMNETYSGTQLTLAASGSDFGIMLDPPGELRLPAGPFEAKAAMAIDERQVRVKGLRFTSGDIDLALDVETPWPPDTTRGQFALEAKGEDITRILPRLAGLDLDALGYRALARGNWADGRVTVDDFQVALGDSTIELSGILALPPDASATNMALQVTVPNLSRIGTLRGIRYGELPFELDTRLNGNLEHMELTYLRARLGQSDIQGQFRLDLAEEKPRFDLKLSTDTLNLRPVLEGQKSTGPEQQKAPKGGRMIPDIELPLDKLYFANGRFVISADRMIGRRTTLYNNLISGTLQDGALRVSEMGVDTSGGRLIIGLDVLPQDTGVAQVSASVHSKNLIFDFSDAPAEQKLKQPPFNIDLDLQGNGSTLRQLAASLRGGFAIYSPGGIVLNSGKIKEKRHLLAQMIIAVSPEAALRTELEISCFAAVGRASDGIIAFEPGMALQSSRINTFSRGTIDLKTERMDLGFESRTRRLVDVSAGELVSPFVRVGGTLADPSIGIDAKGTLLKGGAAVLSGGISMLAEKALRQLDTEDPCKRILDDAHSVEERP
jgi:hypothetical protein